MKINFSTTRVPSIDILRAITMILMIFVNDLWSLKNIPVWLEHVEHGVDGMGLADTIFPAFLFIVGLSLPFSIASRRAKGDSDSQLIIHVLIRSIALLVMGVFLVNGETLNPEAMGMRKNIWYSISCACFILIWNRYPVQWSKIISNGLRIAGILVLVVLAYFYKGGEGEAIEKFAPHWWGILGLIGWAYLVSGLITIFSRDNFYVILGGWLFFAILSMVSHAGLLPGFLHFIPDAIRGGTLTGLTLGGVLTSYIFQYFRNKNDTRNLYLSLGGFALVLMLLSIITRPYWGLAKLGATPAWLFVCSAITIITLLIIYFIVEIKGHESWFSFIRPAGTDTLMCYLIPYFAYATTRVLGIHLPEFILVGIVGLIKSMFFALLCVMITGGLQRLGLKLKI
ncbi:MAG: DUF5009 domain-containing protein [Saprospiraceae bacterium]